MKALERGRVGREFQGERRSGRGHVGESIVDLCVRVPLVLSQASSSHDADDSLLPWFLFFLRQNADASPSRIVNISVRRVSHIKLS